MTVTCSWNGTGLISSFRLGATWEKGGHPFLDRADGLISRGRGSDGAVFRRQHLLSRDQPRQRAFASLPQGCRLVLRRAGGSSRPLQTHRPDHHPAHGQGNPRRQHRQEAGVGFQRADLKYITSLVARSVHALGTVRGLWRAFPFVLLARGGEVFF